MTKYPIVFFKLSAVGFIVLFGMGLLVPVLPIYAKNQLNAPNVVIGLIVSGYFLARLFLDIPGGAISDRIGRRTPILLGTLLGPIGALICGISLNPYIVFLGRIIWGGGVGLFFSAGYSLLFDLFPPNVRGKSMGLFQSLEQIGLFIGSSLGGIMADVEGMVVMFTIIVAVLSVGFLLTFTSRELKAEAGKKVEERKTESTPTHTSFFDLFKIWSLVIVNLGIFSMMFMNIGATNTIFPIYLNGFGISTSLIGILLGIRTIGMILALAVSGFFMSRIGAKALVLAGFSLDAVILIAYTVINTFNNFVPLVFIDGVGSGMTQVSLAVLVSEFIPLKVRGMGVGLYRTFQDTGAMLGPIVLTILLSIVGDLRVCFYFTAILYVTIFFLTSTIRRS